MGLEFRILGPLEAVDDVGRPRALGGRKRRSLLAMLLLGASRPVATDRLLEALWPDATPEEGRRALQVHVSSLRQALGSDGPAIVARSGAYVLELDEDDLDAVRFERYLVQGRGALDHGHAEVARERLGQALGLWRGPALGDLAYEAFAAAEAQRLDELRLAALEARVDADLALGRHADVVAEIAALAAAHPLRERLQGSLMLALYRCGRQQEALAAYRGARAALVDELGLEPGPELRALEARILRHDPELVVEPADVRLRRNLPAPLTALVGRRREIQAVKEQLADGARLLTLTGPGGTGKTRVALQAAHELAVRFADGVFFVDLAPVRDPALVADAIAGRVGVAEEPGAPVAASLADHLRHRRTLLLLDNFEHLDQAAPLVAELLAAAPGLRALATSRSPLRLYGEHVYPLAPLDLADEAVPLFLARARAVAPAFPVAARVADICARLDCLPLAIELAAARVPELSLEEMLETLPRLEVASEGPRDRTDRQRTLRGAIAWSVDLLPEGLRDAYARLGVFVGGWTPAAAAEVAEATAEDLEALVARSLVRERGGRYAMLETIREHAAERLEASGEADAVRRRLAEHVLALAERADRETSAGGDQATWLERVEAEHDNARAALAFAAAAGDGRLQLSLAAALGRFWEWRGHAREGLRRLDEALERDTVDDDLHRRAALRAAILAHVCADLEGSRRRAEQALERFRADGDDRMAANALRLLGSLAKEAGDAGLARARHEEARALSEAAGDIGGVASSVMNLSDVALARGDHAEAFAMAREAVELADRLGDPLRRIVSLANLGQAAIGLGHLDDAQATLRDGARLAGELAYSDGLVACLEGLAAIAAARGDAAWAARLLGASEALLERTGSILEAGEQSLHDRTVAALAGADEAAIRAAWDEGRGWSLREAAERAS